jgi:hypothetical protein
MAGGAGLGGIMTALLPLVGLFTIWQSQRRKKDGVETAEDAEFARRRDARLEMERRMAAYIAHSAPGGHSARIDEPNEEETRR